MTRLTNLTPAEKQFLDDAVAAAERASGKKLNQPNRHIVLNRARAQIESQRHADRQRALREEERQQAEFTWSRPRSPRRLVAVMRFLLQFCDETAGKAFPCIAMQTRRNHQERFSGFSPGKGAGNRHEAAETR